MKILRKAAMTEAERQARTELAACYQVFSHLGWTELIFNHISLRVPGEEGLFLINPYGLTYDEVTPDNLVLVNEQGHAMHPTEWPINPAGFLIHGAIHAARPEVRCVMHTHTTAGIAIASSQRGLLLSDFYSALLHGDVACHDFEGITTEPDEAPQLVAALGTRRAMILRNHGLLSCGKTLPEAFYVLWRLERACQIQLAASAAGPLIELREELGVKAARQTTNFDPEGRQDARIFDALRRQVHRQRPELDWIAPGASRKTDPIAGGMLWPPGP